MILIRAVITLSLFLLSIPVFAGKYYFAYDTHCRNAYNAYMALQLEEGNKAIKLANPDNLMATYIADYGDCLLILFNQDKRDYEKIKNHLSRRIDLLDHADVKSPWQGLCKAGIYLHWAFIHLRTGDNLKAATLFRKSFLLLKENKKAYPSFEYNDLFFGLEEAVAGTIPDDYKWIGSMFGMRGDVKRGMSKIQSFISSHKISDPLCSEAVLFNVYLRFYLLSQQEEVWRFVCSDAYPAKNNLLFSFVKANIGLNYRHADDALQTMKHMQTLNGYNLFPVFEYETGAALLHKLDPAAVIYLKRFLANYKGTFFIKDAWQKIALSYYLHGDEVNAAKARAMIKKYGTTEVDADKQAQRFAESAGWPSPVLLQARMLIDGGYYNRALEKLSIKREADFADVADKAEYNFRAGRVYDELGNDDKALQFYARAIAIGRERKEHFAARSALQAGLIYERRKNTQAALSSFNSCLHMPVQDFKNSITQQAKAGINRLTIR